MNKTMKTLMAIVGILLAVAASLVNPLPASGQSATPADGSPFSLNVSRNFGYSAGGQIRGNFRLTVVGPQESIREAVFLIDDEPIGTVSAAPFRMDFRTQDYPEGEHTISAVVTTLDGETQLADGGAFNFVSAQQQWAGVIKILVVIMGVLAAIVLLGFLFTFLTTGKTTKTLAPGSARSYGIQGGGICPKCGRPFAFHWWGLNMVGSKYDRCDYCGKWGTHKRLPLEDLRAAEQAELASAKGEAQVPGQTAGGKLRDMLEDSKYTD